MCTSKQEIKLAISFSIGQDPCSFVSEQLFVIKNN